MNMDIAIDWLEEVVMVGKKLQNPHCKCFYHKVN